MSRCFAKCRASSGFMCFVTAGEMSKRFFRYSLLSVQPSPGGWRWRLGRDGAARGVSFPCFQNNRWDLLTDLSPEGSPAWLELKGGKDGRRGTGVGGSEGALAPPAWSGLQSPLGIWVYGPKWGVSFCIWHLLENTVWDHPALGHLWVHLQPSPTRARLQDLKDVEEQPMQAVLGTQQRAVTRCVWGGGDMGLSGNHGAEFQRAEARSREFQYRIVQWKSKLSPKEIHTKMGQLIFNKDAKATQWGKDNLSNWWCWNKHSFII